tara:strand:+ start:3371 stop:3658 length:288 start_codon:yes stop_codon:yes gene_type:complete
MTEYTILGDLFTDDSNMPDKQLILEALQDVLDAVDTEGVWTCKGNYKLNFWVDSERPHIIICNAYVLLNPDDDLDSSVEDYCYYFEIEGVNHVSG